MRPMRAATHTSASKRAGNNLKDVNNLHLGTKADLHVKGLVDKLLDVRGDLEAHEHVQYIYIYI